MCLDRMRGIIKHGLIFLALITALAPLLHLSAYTFGSCVLARVLACSTVTTTVQAHSFPSVCTGGVLSIML